MADDYLKRPTLRPLTAGEKIYLNGESLGDVAGFWQWAFSDLRDNTLRGLFGEWLVGLLLGLEMKIRENWTFYDLKYGTVTLGVKAFSYLQPWAQKRISAPVFKGLLTKAWDPDSNVVSQSPAFNTDWYVFCLETCLDADQWNALDLTQWDFFLLPRSTISERGLKSISLRQLGLLARRLTASEFRTEGRETIGIRPGDNVVLVEADKPAASLGKASGAQP
jgi:hypothetical protein